MTAPYTQATFDAARAARPDLHPAQAIMQALGTGPQPPCRTLAERRADWVRATGIPANHPLTPAHLRIA